MAHTTTTLPYRNLGGDFQRAGTSGLWMPVAQKIERNFAEIERILNHGTFTGTTSAGAVLTVTHHASFTPTTVLVTPRLPGGAGGWWQVRIDAITATTFRIDARTETGALLANTSITGLFLCLP